jgi:hypothetical protein
LVDARDYGCTGNEKDSSICVQATIDAAVKKGGGAAAYFAPRTYTISTPIIVHAGNYTVLGSGYQTKFNWASVQHADPAVMVVKGGGAGLKIMHLAVSSGGKALIFDTKILHDGSASSAGSGSGSGVAAESNGVGVGVVGKGGTGRLTTYDEVYTTAPGEDMWNATGVAVRAVASRTCHPIRECARG